MSGNFYLSVAEVMEYASLGKSQVYKMIEKKQLLTHSEEIGGETRHKILPASAMVLLAFREGEYREKANHFKKSYERLKERIEHGR